MQALVKARRHGTLTTERAYRHRVALMAAERAKRIGARMRERREELGLTQPQVADRMAVVSVTKDYISRWELGKVEVSEGYLAAAAKALETDVADLMAGPLAERQARKNAGTPDTLAVLRPPTEIEGQLAELRLTLARIEQQLHELQAGQAASAAAVLARIDESAEPTAHFQTRRRA